MLVDLIGCHPAISPIYETDFLVNLLELLFAPPPDTDIPASVQNTLARFVERIPTMGAKKRPYERYVHGNRHLRFDPAFVAVQTSRLLHRQATDPLGAFQDFVRAMFEHHAANDGKPQWINKTPANLHFARGLRVAFPDMLLIHVVRDGRDVAASVTQTAFGPRTVTEAARWWVATMDIADDFGQQFPQSMLVVRYEDLVRDPATAVAAVLDALDMDVPPRLVTEWCAATGGADVGRIGVWEDHFTSKDRDAFLAIAGPTLERHGYEVAATA